MQLSLSNADSVRLISWSQGMMQHFPVPRPKRAGNISWTQKDERTHTAQQTCNNALRQRSVAGHALNHYLRPLKPLLLLIPLLNLAKHVDYETVRLEIAIAASNVSSLLGLAGELSRRSISTLETVT